MISDSNHIMTQSPLAGVVKRDLLRIPALETGSEFGIQPAQVGIMRS